MRRAYALRSEPSGPARSGHRAGGHSSLGFSSESMDRVLMSEVFEHLDDDAGALGEVWRTLRSGGIPAISVPSSKYPFGYDPIKWVLERSLGRPIRTVSFAGLWANHKPLHSREQLVRVVERAGLEVECSEELTHYCFPGAQFIVYTPGKEPGRAESLARFPEQIGRPFPWAGQLWLPGESNELGIGTL